MLLGLYSGFAENQNTKLQIHAEVPDALPISDVDLCVILSNLLENALEASAKLPSGEREIIVRIGERRGQFIILIENVFDGIFVKDSGKILSLKAQGREGVGIVSVRTVTARYNGETEFYAEENRFFSEIYVPVYREEV
jgi:Signal transduction histidine kinase regulating citrate/malate metabolism